MKDHDQQATQSIHAGKSWNFQSEIPVNHRPIIQPIYQSALFRVADSTLEPIYGRYNNSPNHQALGERLAKIEGGEAGLITSSGMSAISMTLLSVLRQGDHLLLQSDLYGGSFAFVTQELPRLGISYDFVDGSDPGSWGAALRPNTKAFYFESLTNPLLRIAPFEEAIRFTRQHGLVSLIDNTMASPVNFRPLELGFDLSIHSATKYLNGHSDLIAGAVIGKRSWVEEIHLRLKRWGPSLSAQDAFLLERGLKTLVVRVAYQNQAALEVARFLESHSQVKRVYYPSLESHPDFELGKKYFRSGGFGSVLSFELKSGVEGAKKLFRALNLPVEAASFGGVEALISRPVTTSHAVVDREARARMGVTDGLIRLSLGLEGVSDLIKDLKKGLDSCPH